MIEHDEKVSRRSFLGKSAALPIAATLGAGALFKTATNQNLAMAQPTVSRPSVCVFSKHLQFLDYEALAATCVDLGVDSIDLTVRPGGHVEPENLDRDFERAVVATRNAGLDISMISTGLTHANEEADDLMAACAEMGIGYLRIGGHRYNDDEPVQAQMEAITEELAGLTALAAKHEVNLGYHNHSGYGNFGGPVWDLLQAYRSIGLTNIGSNLDLGHVTVEGAFGAGMVIVRLLAELERVHMVALKDFVWENGRPRWLALGDGLVPTQDYLQVLHAQGFSGPISLHFEYNTGGHEGMIEEIRAAVPRLNAWLTEAGYPEKA